MENVIKMGRKVVDSAEITDESKKGILTNKIDSLKEEFNLTGKNVSEAQSNLEASLKLMQKYDTVCKPLENWIQMSSNQLSTIELQSSNHKKQSEFFNETFLEMVKFKRAYLDLYKIHEDITALCNSPSLVTDLEQNIKALEKQWQELADKIKQHVTIFCQVVSMESTLPAEITTELENR